MKRMVALLAGALLQGCGTVHNTIRDGDDDRVMMRGNDPVSYFAGTKPQKGELAVRSGLFGGERSKANRLMAASGLMSKVAHYKTDRELDAEHVRRFGRLPPGAPPLR